jgi:hypothetical protein
MQGGTKPAVGRMPPKITVRGGDRQKEQTTTVCIPLTMQKVEGYRSHAEESPDNG